MAHKEGKGFTGMCHVVETKRKMCLAHTGKKFSEEHKRKIGLSNVGNNPWNKDKNHITDTRVLFGEKCHFWKNGISYEPYGIEFNEINNQQIRVRDDYRCQECFRHQRELSRRLSVHHIDYDKKNNISENLISLCRGCHASTNIEREYWKEYFKQQIGVLHENQLN